MRREKKRRGELSLDDAARCWDSRLTDPAPTPELALEREELRRAVLRGLGQLSEEHRQVLVLRELEGLSYREIAELLPLLGLRLLQLPQTKEALLW